MPLTPRAFGERGRRRAEKLGIDPARLPPGQSPTEKFPVLTIGATPQLDTATWSFSVHGLVAAPFALRWEELLALPQTELTTRPALRDALVEVRHRLGGRPGPRSAGPRRAPLVGDATSSSTRTAATRRICRSRRCSTTTCSSRTRSTGAPLERDHGGPARLLVPQRYLWKSAKWVSALELLDHDEPGLWERNGYHNDGDPWTEERHTADQWSVRQVQRRLRGADPA